ncbi:hypothetical protein [Uliginosibacterium gangwonense]|uniref:hypothetical protein n=1 Tax=Uliginosibacterium gangwonense TaxID=392736 RepID=UPI00037715FB|nr:hypothetical protein [Uliginosibacterium gangwonense]
MKPIILSLLAVLAIQGNADAAEQAEHPILGAWAYTLQDSGCAETYHFRPDGKLTVTSGEEATEGEYEVSVEPDTNGFYTLVDTIVTTNAKKDCSGNTTPAGDSGTNFLFFDPSGKSFFVCQSDSRDSCFGPVKRLKNQ